MNRMAKRGLVRDLVKRQVLDSIGYRVFGTFRTRI